MEITVFGCEAEEHVIFGGRLAEYKYYDMDKVIESAFQRVEKEFGHLNLA